MYMCIHTYIYIYIYIYYCTQANFRINRNRLQDTYISSWVLKHDSDMIYCKGRAADAADPVYDPMARALKDSLSLSLSLSLALSLSRSLSLSLSLYIYIYIALSLSLSLSLSRSLFLRSSTN